MGCCCSFHEDELSHFFVAKQYDQAVSFLDIHKKEISPSWTFTANIPNYTTRSQSNKSLQSMEMSVTLPLHLLMCASLLSVEEKLLGKLLFEGSDQADLIWLPYAVLGDNNFTTLFIDKKFMSYLPFYIFYRQCTGRMNELKELQKKKKEEVGEDSDPKNPSQVKFEDYDKRSAAPMTRHLLRAIGLLVYDYEEQQQNQNEPDDNDRKFVRVPEEVHKRQKALYHKFAKEHDLPPNPSRYIFIVLTELALRYRPHDIPLFHLLMAQIEDDILSGARTRSGKTIFHVLAEIDNSGELIQELISSGKVPAWMKNSFDRTTTTAPGSATMIFESSFRDTPLMIAVRGGRINMVNEFVANNIGGSLSLEDGRGENALHHACSFPVQQNSSVNVAAKIVQMLLAMPGSSAAKDKPSADGSKTPLSCAVVARNVEVVKILLANNVKVELPPAMAADSKSFAASVKYKTFSDFAVANQMESHFSFDESKTN